MKKGSTAVPRWFHRATGPRRYSCIFVWSSSNLEVSGSGVEALTAALECDTAQLRLRLSRHTRVARVARLCTLRVSTRPNKVVRASACKCACKCACASHCRLFLSNCRVDVQPCIVTREPSPEKRSEPSCWLRK